MQMVLEREQQLEKLGVIEMSLLIKKVLEKIKNIDNKLKTNIVTDIEMETNYSIDGKIVYRKKCDFGSLPNTSIKGVQFITTTAKIIKAEGIAISRTEESHYFAIPNTTIKLDVENGWINITTLEDFSNCDAYVFLYYTKNQKGRERRNL